MGKAAPVGVPFSSESARDAAHRSVALRRERAVARQRYSDTLDYLAEEFGDRGKLGPMAFAVTAQLLVAAVGGEIPVPETPLDRLRLAETARIAHGIARLESGESTSNSAVLRLMESPGDATGRLDELQARIEMLRNPTGPVLDGASPS